MNPQRPKLTLPPHIGGASFSPQQQQQALLSAGRMEGAELAMEEMARRGVSTIAMEIISSELRNGSQWRSMTKEDIVELAAAARRVSRIAMDALIRDVSNDEDIRNDDSTEAGDDDTPEG